MTTPVSEVVYFKQDDGIVRIVPGDEFYQCLIFDSGTEIIRLFGDVVTV